MARFDTLLDDGLDRLRRCCFGLGLNGCKLLLNASAIVLYSLCQGLPFRAFPLCLLRPIDGRQALFGLGLCLRRCLFGKGAARLQFGLQAFQFRAVPVSRPPADVEEGTAQA